MLEHRRKANRRVGLAKGWGRYGENLEYPDQGYLDQGYPYLGYPEQWYLDQGTRGTKTRCPQARPGDPQVQGGHFYILFQIPNYLPARQCSVTNGGLWSFLVDICSVERWNFKIEANESFTTLA